MLHMQSMHQAQMPVVALFITLAQPPFIGSDSHSCLECGMGMAHHCACRDSSMHICRYAPDEGVAQQMDAYWPRANKPVGYGAAAGGQGGGGSGYNVPGQENQWYNGPSAHPSAGVQQPADGSKVYFQVR